MWYNWVAYIREKKKKKTKLEKGKIYLHSNILKIFDEMLMIFSKYI